MRDLNPWTIHCLFAIVYFIIGMVLGVSIGRDWEKKQNEL